MARMRAAKAAGDASLAIWGTGRARREFLYVDDVADAAVFLMRGHSWEGPLNIGSGVAVSIAELAKMLKEITGSQELLLSIRPNRRNAGEGAGLLQTGRPGWSAKVDFGLGLGRTYDWYLEQK
jgi:GDP-L-fucose synthase